MKVYKRVSINRFPFCKSFLFGVHGVESHLNFCCEVQLNGYSSPFKCHQNCFLPRIIFVIDVCHPLPSPFPLLVSTDSHQVEKLWQSSHHCLTTGLGHFEAVGNRPNLALLYANLGSLMRSCAEIYRSSLSQQTEELADAREFSSQEKLYFNR